MPTLDPLIARYLHDRMRRDHLSMKTIRNLRNHLGGFSRSFGDRPLDKLGPAALDRWIATLADYAPATRALHISSVRVFARWCVYNRLVYRDWTVGAPVVRRPRRQPRDVVEAHAFALLAVARDEREKLIVWFQFGCGLRCVEVSRLDVDDYESESRLLHVRGKSDHERSVPVPRRALSAMLTYLAVSGHASGAMIRRADGTGRVGPERISGIVNHLWRVSGLKVRKYDGRSAHGLRACFASDLIDSGAAPTVVQEAMGHASIGNLTPYLRRSGHERLREAIDNRWSEPA